MKNRTIFAAMLLFSAAPLFAQVTAAPAGHQQAAPAVVPAASPAPMAKKAPSQPKVAGDQKGVEGLFSEASEAWGAGDSHKMAELFTPDSTLINPAGKEAHGRAEIEQLFTSELSGLMKGTQQTFSDFTVRFYPLPNIALVDCTGTVTGMKNPDGTEAEPMPTHVFGIAVNRTGKKWQALTIRAYSFLRPSAPVASAPAAPMVPGISATPAMPAEDNVPPAPDFDQKK